MMCFWGDRWLKPEDCCGSPAAGMQTGTCSCPVVTTNIINKQNSVTDIVNIVLNNATICTILYCFVTIDIAFDRNRKHVSFVLLRPKQF